MSKIDVATRNKLIAEVASIYTDIYVLGHDSFERLSELKDYIDKTYGHDAWLDIRASEDVRRIADSLPQ